MASVTAEELIFCSGTHDQKIRVFDVDDGQQRWEYKLPFVGSATPSIYGANGKQYIMLPDTDGFPLWTASSCETVQTAEVANSLRFIMISF